MRPIGSNLGFPWVGPQKSDEDLLDVMRSGDAALGGAQAEKLHRVGVHPERKPVAARLVVGWAGAEAARKSAGSWRLGFRILADDLRPSLKYQTLCALVGRLNDGKLALMAYDVPKDLLHRKIGSAPSRKTAPRARRRRRTPRRKR